MKNIFLVGFALGLLCSCVPKAKYIAEDFSPPVSLALLPMANQSNDLDAPEIARDLMLDELIGKGYVVKPFEETDEILRKNGISEGGQLNAITPEKLGKELGVDALVYGEVIDFSHTNIGVYRNRKVSLNFKVIDTSTGKPVWEDERTESNKEFAFDKDAIGRSFAEGLAERVVEKIVSSPLLPECREVVRRIALTLPPAR